jgi:O-acetyl-ADP-ribose deacetylase (regulator of RNase III)
MADALVSAAGTSLEMGSGVAGALRLAAGGELNAAAVDRAPVELSAVAVTDAFDPNADYVIHAVAMPHYGDGQATASSIRDAPRNTLTAADERGCNSLVIPALSCRVAGFPLSDGAELICREIDAFEPTHLEDVRSSRTARRSSKRCGP